MSERAIDHLNDYINKLLEQKEINLATTIANRVRKGEEVDVVSLFNNVLEAENYAGPERRKTNKKAE